MSLKSEEIGAELAHQHSLLSISTQNLHLTQIQIAQFGLTPPIYLLNQQTQLEADITKISRAIQELEQQKELATDTGQPIVVTELVQTLLPTGVLHLYSHDNLPILKYTVNNHSSTDMSVIVSSQIEQFSYSRNDTIFLKPGESKILGQLPTLILDQIKSVYNERKCVLHTQSKLLQDGKETLLYSQDHDVFLQARDVLVWAIILDDNTVYDLSYQLAAWVTPNARAIVDLLDKAAHNYHPTRTLEGYSDYTEQPDAQTLQQQAVTIREQVKAIFEAVKHVGKITYINSTISFGSQKNDVQQRINLPEDSLAHHQANCIDGAVLYASLLERINIYPVILLVPGHAFVGWKVHPNANVCEFLETTMTGNSSFEEAFQTGMDEYQQVEALVGRPLFDPSGYAVMHDVYDLHQKNVFPL
jgi:hypothetical protein